MLCRISGVFLFFFKQKTAYEMRISDWSSDVCSSDLAEEHQDHRGGTDHLLADVVGHQPAVQAHGGAEECLVARLAEQFAGVRIEVAALAATAAILRRESDHQIGRASCRERVCQYV